MKNLKIMSAAMAAMMTISALSISALADELNEAPVMADASIEQNVEEQQPVIDAVLDDTEVTLNEKNDTVTLYTGGAITPDVVLYSNGTRLAVGTDYTLTYENNTNVGQATITVTFIGNYTGTRTLHFNIVARELGQNDIVISVLHIIQNKKHEEIPFSRIKIVIYIQNDYLELTCDDLKQTTKLISRFISCLLL